MERSFYPVLSLAFCMVMTSGVGLAGDAWDETIRSQDRQIESLETHVAVLEQQREDRQMRLDFLAEMQEEILRMGLELEKMRSALIEVQSSTREVEEEFAAYRERYRQSARIQAVGEKLPSLTTASGKAFQDVTIKKVTGAGVVIWHQDGTTRVVFNDLPRTIQDRFQWDPQEAAALLEAESEREARREACLARQLRQEAEKRQKQAVKAAVDRRIASLERQLQAQRTASASSSALQSSGRLGATRAFGTGSIYRYRPYYDDRYYRSRYYGGNYTRRSYRPTVTYYSTRYPSRSYLCPSPSRSTRSSYRSPSNPRPPQPRYPTPRRKPVSSVSPTIR